MNNIALVSSESVRSVMAGIGIRYLSMAQILFEQGFNVCLYYPEPEKNSEVLDDLPFPHVFFKNAVPGSELEKYEIVITQGRIAAEIARAGISGRLVIDLYDPYLIENMSYCSSNNTDIYQNDHSEWISVLQTGDFFLCANNGQRLFYLGWLAALDRIDPVSYKEDKAFRHLIEIVSFGVDPPDSFTPVLEPVEPSVCRMLFGGVYDWYDPWILLDAVRELPDVQVIFVNNPNPATTPQGILHKILEYRELHPASKDQIKIIDWVPYTRRYDLLHDVDMLVAPHEAGIEAELSLRTRYIEALSVGCPVICTAGGSISELVNEFGGGIVVPELDSSQLRNAITRIINGKEVFTDPSASIRFADKYSWKNVLSPLINYCRQIDKPQSNTASGNSALHTPVCPVEQEVIFSIVLPTYNRMDTLPEVIHSLVCQKNVHRFELVIINDGSSDGTREWLDDLSVPFPCKITHTENAGPAAARNLGVSLCEGNVVLMLGDDMILDPFWLFYHQSAHLKDDKLATGVAYVGHTDWDQRVRIGPFLRHVDKLGWQFGYELIEDTESLGYNFFYGSNVSINKKYLLDNKFNESFPYAAWEDTELGLRLVSKGVTLKYLPSARSRHMHQTSVKRFYRRHRNAGFASVRFFEMHPGLNALPIPSSDDLEKNVSGRVADNARLALAVIYDYLSVDAPWLWDLVLRDSYSSGFRQALQNKKPDSPVSMLNILPLEWCADSPTLFHNTGHIQNGRWVCDPGRDTSGHCVYGPYLKLDIDARLVVEIDMQWMEKSEPHVEVASVDVYDNASDEILADFVLVAQHAGPIKLFFQANKGQTLEFRVYWHANVTMSVSTISLSSA